MPVTLKVIESCATRTIIAAANLAESEKKTVSRSSSQHILDALRRRYVLNDFEIKMTGSRSYYQSLYIDNTHWKSNILNGMHNIMNAF